MIAMTRQIIAQFSQGLLFAFTMHKSSTMLESPFPIPMIMLNFPFIFLNPKPRMILYVNLLLVG